MWLIWKINFCIQVYRISEIYLCTLWKIMPSNFSKFRWQLVWVHVVLSIYMCMYTISILLIHILLPWLISNVGICFSSTDLIPWKIRYHVHSVYYMYYIQIQRTESINNFAFNLLQHEGYFHQYRWFQYVM